MDLKTVLKVIEPTVKNLKAPVKDFEKVQTKDPFKILVATILSSRTKDEITTKAVERLFEKIRRPDDLERLKIEEIERLIYPVGFYRNKARHLALLPHALKNFGGKVPDSMDSLLKLPGVGRKTANLVLARAFGKPAICVDTHVHRLVNMWGFVHTKTPEQTERALQKLIPRSLWAKINPVLVAFGQKICRPTSPCCISCPLNRWCPSNSLDIEKSS